MDITMATDIATRFINRSNEYRDSIWEEEDSISNDSSLFLQLQSWSDESGNRTYVDVVSYPSDTVNVSKRVDTIEDVEKIANAILDASEEAGVLVDRTCVVTIIGKKTGQAITLQHYGDDDYGAWFRDVTDYHNELAGFSVRGTLVQVLDEIKEEV